MPEEPVTREQIAVMLVRYAKFAGIELPKSVNPTAFEDAGKISPWAKGAVEAVQMSGLINGKPGNMFDPQGMATRAEVAAIMQRFIENVLK